MLHLISVVNSICDGGPWRSYYVYNVCSDNRMCSVRLIHVPRGPLSLAVVLPNYTVDREIFTLKYFVG